MLPISFTDSWHKSQPDSLIGILEVSGISNSASSVTLNQQKRILEVKIRDQYRGFSREDFNAISTIGAYRKYYKLFKKSYHVQLQLESVVLKGKNLPQISPLVDANVVAELDHLILTAGHDV